MSKSKSYNGHKNFNHWNISLWINNDEGLYRLALECIRNNPTKDVAAEVMLDCLQCDDIYKTPDGAPYSISSIRAAMIGM